MEDRYLVGCHGLKIYGAQHQELGKGKTPQKEYFKEYPNVSMRAFAFVVNQPLNSFLIQTIGIQMPSTYQQRIKALFEIYMN